MFDGIDAIHSPAPFSTEKISGSSSQFNLKKSGQDLSKDLDRNEEGVETSSDRSSLGLNKDVLGPDEVQNISTTQGQESLSDPISSNFQGNSQLLLHQLSMLTMPVPNVPDPTNVPKFEETLQMIVGNSPLIKQLTEAQFERVAPPSKSQRALSDQELEQLPQRTSLNISREKLNDPMVRSALKLMAKQPEQGCLETLALEMATKSIDVASTTAKSALSSAQSTLAIQKESDATGLRDFKQKLEKSREEIQKAMKNPIARWFSAIFKGIAGVVAALCTADVSLALKAISSAHDDAIKAQYDPKNGKSYDEILKKLSKSPFQSKWFKVLTTIVGVVSTLAIGVYALPKMMISSGKMLTKLGTKKFLKFSSQESGEGLLKKGGAKLEKMGAKLSEKEAALYRSAKSFGNKLLDSAKGAASKSAKTVTKSVKKDLSALQTEGMTASAKVSRNFSKESKNFSSATTEPLHRLGHQIRGIYSYFSHRPLMGGLMQTGLTALDAGENFVEARATATSKQTREKASIGMDNQRMRYARMSASISDFTTRMQQEQSQVMSQAINTGSEIMKELGNQKLRITAHRL